MAKIVIIGAGLTGLSAAYHLEQNGFFDYVLLEKEASPGGLCRSVTQDGFTFDYTGHLLHINDAYFRAFIEEIVGLDQFNTITRRSFVYSHGRYTRYPYQVNLFGLPTHVIVECINQFAQRPKKKIGATSFYQWVLHSFGKGLGKHFFFPYQSKIFDYDIKKLSASWTGRFVPNTSLEELLVGSLEDKKEQEIGYNAHFFYPKAGGIYHWVDALYKRLSQPIRFNAAVKEVNLQTNTVTLNDGSHEHFDYVITTMPLDTLLNRLKEKSSSSLQKSSRFLLCNSVINFNLGVHKENLEHKHWIYYPEPEYPFYRIGFTSNFAHTMAPPGCSSLYGELSYLKRPQLYTQNLLHESLTLTKKLFGIEAHTIATEKIIVIDHAYVIYNRWRDTHLPTILRALESENVHSVGRYGAWKYSSMQEAVLDGKEVALKALAQLAPELIQIT